MQDERKEGEKNKSPSIKVERARETSDCGDLPARSKPFRRDGTVGGNEIGGCAE